MRPGERVFVLWTGLKGTVPILPGAFIVQARVTGAPRIYESIFVVVAFSVIGQGAAVPGLARRMGVPLRTIEPGPWSLDIGSRGSLRGPAPASPSLPPPPPTAP